MTTKEHNRRMAMLQAAQPYTAGRQRYALDLLLQANALMNTARSGFSSDLEACEVPARPEEMLVHMQEFCTPRESDLIQMILNFIKAGHLFQNYREFMAAQYDTPETGDLHAAGTNMPYTGPLQMLLQLIGGLGSLSGFGNSGDSDQLMNFLITQLSPEQRQLFEQLKSFSAASENTTANTETEDDYGNMATE